VAAPYCPDYDGDLISYALRQWCQELVSWVASERIRLRSVFRVRATLGGGVAALGYAPQLSQIARRRRAAASRGAGIPREDIQTYRGGVPGGGWRV